jgi:PAS domain S-box-containing protein
VKESAVIDRRRQRDELLRLLVESVTDYAIFVISPEGRVVTWNEGAARITGYAEEDIVGQSFSVFFPKNDVKRGRPDRELRMAAEQGRFEEEAWRVRRDGTPFWANVVLTPLRNLEGELVGFAKIVRDLSERRRSEDERRELLDRERQARADAELALEQLRALHSVTETALAHIGLDDLLSSLLERVKELLAVDTIAVLLLADEEAVLVACAAKGLEEEVERGVRIPVGSGFAGRIASERTPIVLSDVEHADVLNPVLRTKGVKSLAGVPLLVEGRVVGVLHVGSLRRREFAAEEMKFLQIVADRMAIAIDHARLYEAALSARRQATTAEAMVRARDEFLQIAAHELKTPMTGAKAAVQLLKRTFARAQDLSPLQLRTLDSIERQMDRLAQLVGQLLEAVRTQAGMLSVEPAPADVALIVNDVAEQTQTATAKHTIVVESPDHLVVSIDAFRFEQVVRNLLDNAVKYSPDGGEIRVDLSRTGGHTFLLSIRDHGLGVAPEHRSHLFDRFYQAHHNRSGMGLGLFITRQIVEAHGGTIFAEFPSDGGTRLVVSIPVEPPARSPRSVRTG